MTPTRVAIVGSRKFGDPNLAARTIRALCKANPDVILVSGGCHGPDRIAEEIAADCQVAILVFPAQWDRHGRSAGFIRNRLIVEHCDRVIAFWDGKSRGTKSTIDLAEKAGKPVEIVRADQ